MSRTNTAAATLLVALCAHACSAAGAATSPRISWWVVQGAVPAHDAANLAVMQNHTAAFSALQPYMAAFNDCSDGNITRCWGKDAQVAPYVKTIKGLGIELLPSIINLANATQMHLIYDNQTAFIADAVNVAAHYGFDGYQIDYEPQWPRDPAPDAAQRFADFLKAFSTAMTAKGMRLTVAVATWSNVLVRADLLSASGVSELQDMETYGGATPALVAQLYDGVKKGTGNLDAAGIGLGPYVTNYWTPANLNSTLAYIQQQGGSRVDIFRLLMDGTNNWPADWWFPPLEAFASGEPIVVQPAAA